MILDSICPARLMSRTPCQYHKSGYEFVVDIPNLLFSTATISLRPVGLMAQLLFKRPKYFHQLTYLDI